MKDRMHPGEFLKSAFMEPLGLTVRALAGAIGVAPATISNLTNCKTNMTPEIAVRLSTYLGGSAERWMNMQAAWAISLLPEVSDEEAEKLIDEAYRKIASGEAKFSSDADVNAMMLARLSELRG